MKQFELPELLLIVPPALDSARVDGQLCVSARWGASCPRQGISPTQVSVQSWSNLLSARVERTPGA